MMEEPRRPVTWEFGHLNGNIGSLLGRYPGQQDHINETGGGVI